MKFSAWRAKFTKGAYEYLDKLSDVGLNTAEYQYSNNEYVGDGVVTVESIPNPSGFDIVASGKAAPFLEFGAGVYTAAYRNTIAASYEIAPGSYSAENNGMFAAKGYWYWHGQRFYGFAPTMGLQLACDEMQRQSPSIARRAFR